MKISQLIIATIFLFEVLQCANILGISSLCTYSIHKIGFKLFKELAARGHNVTVISCWAPEDDIANYKTIVVGDNQAIIQDKKKGLYEFGRMTYWNQLKWVQNFGLTYTELTLRHKNVQKLLNSSETFDLFIFEHFMNEAFAIFGHKFKCPTILLTPGPTTEFNNFLVGNPAPPAYVPSLLANFDSRMTFWERAKNTYYGIISQIHVNFDMLPAQNDLLKKVIPKAPELNTILYNNSLMLTLSQIGIYDPIPLQPNIKDVGGYHIDPPKPLPKDLQEFLENAKEGVIMFSMGSNLKSSAFPDDKKKAILETFSKLKQKVLWKFEADLPEKPSNVKIMKWLPQNEILAHPNVVAFISHGGLLGTTEAIHYGVPMLGLPVFWDQVKNMEDAHRKGYAINLGFNHLTKESFEWSLNEILNNPKYRENIKTRSKIMKDQPLKPMDEAVFWIEYIIRHKGAPHLRPASMDLTWFQVYLLDVLTMVVLVIFTPIVLLYIIFKKISHKKPIITNTNGTIEKKNK